MKPIDIIRYFLSLWVTLGALGIIFYGIGAGYAALPGSPVVLFILFFLGLVLLGYLEGLQVAILALEKVTAQLCFSSVRTSVGISLTGDAHFHCLSRTQASHFEPRIPELFCATSSPSRRRA